MENQNTCIGKDEYTRLVRASAQERAPILARWLWVPIVLSFVFLFILFSGIAFLSYLEETLTTAVLFPGGYALYGLVLLRLAAVEKRYLPAALCTLGAAAALAVALYGSEILSINLFGGLLYFWMFLSAAGIYLRCDALGNSLSGVDLELMQKWRRIRLWRPICMTIAPLCFALSDLLGGGILRVIGILAMLINLMVLVRELILLYQTRSAFAKYAKGE